MVGTRSCTRMHNRASALASVFIGQLPERGGWLSIGRQAAADLTVMPASGFWDQIGMSRMRVAKYLNLLASPTGIEPVFQP